ncbi:GCN5-related N-acetyltransferase [Desulfarculus baarsii DSM 2075]|jgi:GNAT superfamily N-acetyltransferase|uniref:GCN5-related N-acetyltransferase n=1 Tax=Desulfarculus baarsii (strain ATCC 33931 / DSM 2075 / LMG 7858 / VKM B-1802 / 2st14) TaxID=644282 RepID=E1QK21_DESB2|nr:MULTISPECIES: GNAT family N-acetyltransferase [Thermodesulfobacteriota]ADK85914.1 GCN5-related N-acetyltransferase [Desulfarculus baarsii DSM 2075]
MGGRFGPVHKLTAADEAGDFDCGQQELNLFLQRYALVNQRANSAQTYVSCVDDAVVGYYSLCVGSVGFDEAPHRVVKGLARHRVPVMLLARLGVDQRFQRQGLGRALLKDAILRTMQAADIAGIRALLAHAKDEHARQWYLSWDFEPSPTDPFHLFLLIKDMRAAGRQDCLT